MTLFEFDELISASCIFCGYNGQGFYQPHTHNRNCPFYEIGGLRERMHALVVWGKKGMLRVTGFGQQASEPTNEQEQVGKCPACGRKGDDRIEECYFFDNNI